MSKDLQKLPVLQGEFLTDLTALDRFREGIIRVENQNKSWWLPRFGLRESIRGKSTEGALLQTVSIAIHGTF